MATLTQRQNHLTTLARLLREPGEALTREADHREALAAMRAAPQADREALADELEQLAKTAAPARADRYDDDLSPRDRLAKDLHNMHRRDISEDNARGDELAHLEPRDRLVVELAGMGMSKAALRRGFDG